MGSWRSSPLRFRKGLGLPCKASRRTATCSASCKTLLCPCIRRLLRSCQFPPPRPAHRPKQSRPASCGSRHRSSRFRGPLPWSSRWSRECFATKAREIWRCCWVEGPWSFCSRAGGLRHNFSAAANREQSAVRPGSDTLWPGRGDWAAGWGPAGWMLRSTVWRADTWACWCCQDWCWATGLEKWSPLWAVRRTAAWRRGRSSLRLAKVVYRHRSCCWLGRSGFRADSNERAFWGRFRIAYRPGWELAERPHAYHTRWRLSKWFFVQRWESRGWKMSVLFRWFQKQKRLERIGCALTPCSACSWLAQEWLVSCSLI